MTDITVREATTDELPAVLGILDGAALETDADRVRAGIEHGDVLVAVPDTATDDDADGTDRVAGRSGDSPGRTGGETASGGGTPVGALVLDGAEVANVAVRRRRRGQGVGSALVEAAAARRDRLVAECDTGVRPFYESLEFALEPVGEDRYRARRDR